MLWAPPGVHPAARALAGRARGGRAERRGRHGPAGGRQPQAPAAQGAGARRALAARAARPARRLQVSLVVAFYLLPLVRHLLSGCKQ